MKRFHSSNKLVMMTKDELEDFTVFSPDTGFSVIEIEKARDAINPPRKPSQTPGSETALTTKRDREREPLIINLNQ